MKAYSSDLRSKILAAVDAGMSKSEAARVFGVGRSTIKRYAALRRNTGSINPRPRPGKRPTLSRDYDPALWVQLEQHPDVVLADHCALWEQQQGMRVSTATMSRAIRRLHWTRKKRRWEPPSGTTRGDVSGTRSSASSMPGGFSSSMRPGRTPA